MKNDVYGMTRRSKGGEERRDGRVGDDSEMTSTRHAECARGENDGVGGNVRGGAARMEETQGRMKSGGHDATGDADGEM